MRVLLQQAVCPTCRRSWDLEQIVAVDDPIECKFGCDAFAASSDTVTCCAEDGEGLVQLPLNPALCPRGSA